VITLEEAARQISFKEDEVCGGDEE